MLAKAASVFLALFISLSVVELSAQTARINDTAQTLMTYPYSDPDPIPVFGEIYPYFRFDGYAARGAMKSWKMVELENAYIKLWVTPEIGGKVWGAVDNKTGKEFLYYNHTVKFRDIAMRGPWTSGGLEINFGIIGHAPTCSSPVDYIVRVNPDSSVSCFVGALDLPSRTEWRVEIRLPKDKAAFLTRALWFNGSPVEQSYYQWMNAAEKTAGNLEYAYPGYYYLGHDGSHAAYPVDEKGRKISWYEHNNFGPAKSYHVAGAYTGFYGGYWHNDDFGFGHYSDYDEKPGKKIWIWGLSRNGMIWENLLTDKDGQYTEIQSGRLFNQSGSASSYTPFKHRGFSPYSSDYWNEEWFPVHGTKGLTYSSADLTINIRKDEPAWTLYLYAIAKINNQLKVYESENLKIDQKLDMLPEEVQKFTLPEVSGHGNWKIMLGDEILYSSDIEGKELNRPVDLPEDFNFNSVYGLYLQGKEWERQRYFDSADIYYNKCLEIEPYYSPALNGLAGLFNRRMNYTEALALLRKSLSVDTYDPEANYFYGLVNISLGNEADALDGFSIASQSVDYRAASYTQLSAYFISKGELYKAGDYLTKTLLFNKHNLLALNLQVMVNRKLGRNKEAESEINRILYFDPLNHFARFEKYLLNPDTVNASDFRKYIRNELSYESYLELAITYYNLHQYQEALMVAEMAPRQAMIVLWEAYLNQLNGNTAKAQNLLNDDAGLTPDFVFPFRQEDDKILSWAVMNNDNWKFKYYKALLYAHFSKTAEALDLLNECGNEPGFYPFYITRANLQTSNEKKEEDLINAFRHSNEWRPRLILAKYYAAENKWERADSLVESYFKSHESDYIFGLFYAKCLLHLDKSDEGIAMMSRLQVLPNEGATEGRTTWRELALSSAIEKMKKQNYKVAIEKLQLAKEWPENLGVGRPYDVDERIEDFLLSYCYSKIGNKKSAGLFSDKTYAVALSSGYAASSSADLLSAISLCNAGKRENADILMENWKENEPVSKTRQWCDAVYYGNIDSEKRIDKEWELSGNLIESYPAPSDPEFWIIKKIRPFLNINNSAIK